jgi:outer membrane receptor for ferrienterochelin and colicin
MAVIAMPMAAQDMTGTMLGTAVDKDGRKPLAGVTISISSPALIQGRSFTTGADGTFRFPLLPPGEYSVRASKDGYMGARQTVYLSLGGSTRVELSMSAIGVATETVEVLGRIDAQDKTETKTQSNFTAEKLDLLPRPNKELFNAAILTPGVVSGVGSRMQIRGAQTFDTKVTLNGTEISDNVFGTNLATRAFYVDDAIAEIQVITSPINARYGSFTGGIINAVTKSGSNQWSGVLRAAEISRASWRSNPPLGPFRPNEDLVVGDSNNRRTIGSDNFTKDFSLWLGGPIIKDKLWFALSTKISPTALSAQRTDALGTNVMAIYSGYRNRFPEIYALPFYAGDEGGVQFFRKDSKQFYEGKLTFSIAEGHTLEYTGNRNSEFYDPRGDYVRSAILATKFAITQVQEYNYNSLSYMGVLPSNITLEARYAKKHQSYIAGGDPAYGPRVRALAGNGQYWDVGNGMFDRTDGGDLRDITTFFANATWYSPKTFIGTHVVEVGLDWNLRERNSQNRQAPGNEFFDTCGRYKDPVTGEVFFVMLDGNDDIYGAGAAGKYYTASGPAQTNTYSFYANDTLTVNDNWQVMLGLRYDQANMADTEGNPKIKTSALAPRFQLTYDPLGNQRWLFKASWARYVGVLSDGFSNRFSRAGNPASEWFFPKQTNTRATYADVINWDNYDLTVHGLLDFGDPAQTRFVQENLKLTGTDETALEVRYNSSNGSWIRATFLTRSWANMFDRVFTLDDVIKVRPISFPEIEIDSTAEYWRNVDNINRSYKSLEIEFNNQFTRQWSLGGAVVFSTLQGNADGEGSNPAVVSSAVNSQADVHARYGRDVSYYAPDGYLSGDIPYRINTWLAYTNTTAEGINFGSSLMFTYNAAGPSSSTVGLFFEGQEMAADMGYDDDLVRQWGSGYTRWFGARGYYRTNDTYAFSLQANLEIPIYRKMRFFVEATITGLFNQWMVAGYSKEGSGTQADERTHIDSDPSKGFNPMANGYIPNSMSPIRTVLNGVPTYNWYGFGTYGYGNMSGQRNLVFSAGLKW